MPALFPRPLLRAVLVTLLSSLATAAFAQQQPAKPPPGPDEPGRDAAVAPQPPQQRYWTTNWSFQDVDVQNLLARLNSIGLEIPVDAEGDVSVAFTVSVPWTSLRDGKAYRFQGRIRSKRLRLEHLLLEDFDADVTYRDGVLNLADVQGRWTDNRQLDPSVGLPVADSDNDSGQATAPTGGSFKGNASVEVLPRGDFQATLQADSLPIGPLHDLLLSVNKQADARAVGGIVSGDLQFRAPVDQLREVTRWTVDADLQIDDFGYDGAVPLSADTGRIRIRDGIIHLDEVHVTSSAAPDIRIDLAAQLELIDRRRFQFRIRANDAPLETFSEIAVPGGSLARGKLDLDAEGRGELGSGASATPVWDISGRVGSPMLSVLGQPLGLLEHQFRFDQQQLEFVAIDTDTGAEREAMLLKQFSAQYRLEPDVLEMSDLSARLFGGTLRGDAVLARKPSGEHQFHLTWQDLQPVFRTGLWFPADVELTAITSGDVQWTVAADAMDRPASHRGVARLRVAELSIGEAKVGDVQMEVRAGGETIQLQGEGTLFGGGFRVETSSDVVGEDSWQTLLSRPPTLHVNAEAMDLGAVVRVLQPDARRRWDGKLSAKVDFLPDAAMPATFQPKLIVSASALTVDGQRLSRRFDAQLKLRGNEIAIERAHGTFAGGRFAADGRWSLGTGPGQVQVRISGIDASKALMFLSATAADRADGKVSGSFSVANGERLRIRGAITSRESYFFAVPTGDVNSGLVASVSRDLRRWEVRLPSIHGQLAGGRITGDAKLSSSSLRPGSMDLASHWKARKVDFGELLASVGSSSRIAHGRLTGSLSLGGQGIRSVDDLAGRFDAGLNATQASAVPGLLGADRYLGIITLGGTQFDEGYIQGVIGGGAANINEFWLRADRVRVWADGMVRLVDVRMDLDVVISTGSFGIGNANLLVFMSQLAIQSVLPVATLLEISRLLSNRTIHLDIRGPLSDPRTRIKPVETIREEAARFLLRELLVAATAVNSDR